MPRLECPSVSAETRVPEHLVRSGDACRDPHGLGVSDEALSLHHAAPR